MTRSQNSASSPDTGQRTGDGATFAPMLFILVAALLWSTGGLFIKVTSLSILELSFGRSLLAALVVAFFTRREGFRLNLVTGLAAVLYSGVLILFVVATKLTTAANAIFLQYTAPVYILIFEPLFYKEKFRGRDLAVIVVCLAGMSLFFLGKLDARQLSGNVAALASGFCFAFFALLLRHPQAAKVNHASSVIYGNLLLATVALVLLVFVPDLSGTTGWRISLADACIILYLGIVQLGIGYTLFTLGMSRGVRSLDAGIVGYIEPVLNPVWVFIFIGERPSAWALLGGGIIVAAVVFHMLKGGKKSSHSFDADAIETV